MDRSALLDAYLGGPDRLRSAVTGLSREQMISRPITGRWSVLETVGQMINGAVEHLAHHVAFVIEKRRALGID